MGKFSVCLTYDTTRSCVVEIEADDEDSAEEKALELYDEKSGDLPFETDDNPPYDLRASWVEQKGDSNDT